MFEGTRRPTAHRQSRRRIARAAEQACGILAPYLGSRPEPLEPRLLLAHDPVIELRFNEAIDSQTVTDSASAGGVVTGTFAGDILASPPVNSGQWFQVTHTRNSTTGAVRTYVNGVLVSTAVSQAGDKGAEFSSIGATTDVNNDLTTIEGYNYFNGDLDQVEIF